MRSSTRRPSGAVVRLPSRGTRRWRGLLIGFGVVLVGSVVLSSIWRVREVTVVGAERVSVEQIARAASLAGDERILLTRLDRVADRVRAIPSIREATVERALWATVVIRVRERVPLAALADRPHLVVDADGVIFEAASDGLPSLSGWRGRAAAGERVDPSSADVLAAFAAFPGTLRARTVGIVIGDELTLAIQGGAKVLFGDPSDLARKAAAADTVLSDAGRRGMALAYVDVRTPSTPVAREWDVATPEPEPSPPATPTD